MTANISSFKKQSSLTLPKVTPLYIGDYRLTKTLGQGSYGKVKCKTPQTLNFW